MSALRSLMLDKEGRNGYIATDKDIDHSGVQPIEVFG